MEAGPMPKLNWQIVDRYLAGEATASERALVERWMADSPMFRHLVAEIQREQLDDAAVQKMEAEVRARLQRDIARPLPVPDRRRVPRLIRAVKSRSATVLKAAAVVALLLGGTLLTRPAINRSANPPSAPTLHTTTAPIGRRMPVSLPDGSEVVLSPGSTLQYARALGTAMRREVMLTGEAYFNVRHDAQRPFVVRAGDLTAEDLGTQFVVRAYPEDRHARVAVREGLVGIAGAVVSPGEIGRLSATGEAIVESANIASWFSWTEGRLAFDRMALRDALPKLSRWYDLDFRLGDASLGGMVVVATLPETSSEDAVEALGLALGLRMVREGRVVTLLR